MAGLCGLLATVPFLGLLRPNTYLALLDVLPYLAPLRQSALRSLAAGGWPWWDSYVQCGQSLCGNPISGIFYPPFLLSLVLPGWWGIRLFLLLHYFFIGVAGFLFFRLALRLPAIASAVGSVMLSSCGYMNCMAFGFHFTSLPWMLASACLWAESLRAPGARRQVAFAAAAGLAQAMSLLAGELQQVLVGTVLLAGGSVWLVVRTPSAWRGRWSLRRIARTAVPFAVVISLVFAVPAFVILRSFSDSVRSSGLGEEEVLRWSASPLRLLEVLLPYLWGVPDTGGPYGGKVIVGLDSVFSVPWCPTLYLGVLWLLLIAVPVRAGRKPLALLLWLLAAVAFLFALGRNTPLYPAFLRMVPVFRVFRYPEKWLLWFSFAASGLAALKMESLLRLRPRGGRPCLRLNLVWPVLLTASLVTLELMGWREWHTLLWQQNRRTLVWFLALVVLWNVVLAASPRGRFGRLSPALWASLLLGLLCLDLQRANVLRDGQISGPDPLLAANNPAAAAVLSACEGSDDLSLYRLDSTAMEVGYVAPAVDTQYAHLARTALELREGVPACFGIRSTRGLYPNETARHRQLRQAFLEASAIGSLWDLTSARFLVVPRTEGGSAADSPFPVLYDDPRYGFAIRLNQGAVPRLKLFRDWRMVEGPTAALDHLRTVPDRGSFLRTVVVEDLPGVDVPAPPVARDAQPGPATDGTLAIVSDRSGHIVLGTETPGPACLLIGECTTRGWRAEVDGRRVALHPANVCFMGVFLEPGTHTVSLKYSPFR